MHIPVENVCANGWIKRLLRLMSSRNISLCFNGTTLIRFVLAYLRMRILWITFASSACFSSTQSYEVTYYEVPHHLCCGRIDYTDALMTMSCWMGFLVRCNILGMKVACRTLRVKCGLLGARINVRNWQKVSSDSFSDFFFVTRKLGSSLPIENDTSVVSTCWCSWATSS